MGPARSGLGTAPGRTWQAPARDRPEGISRQEILGALFVLGFANGLSIRVADLVAQRGLWPALMSTFDVSIFVWAAFVVSVALMLQGPRERATRRDLAAAAFGLGLIFLPSSPLSWLALTGLSAYAAAIARARSPERRSALVMLALTVPAFWSRVVFSFLGDAFLRADAILVAWVLGTERAGNTIQLADGSGTLWIAPGCSSVANLSGVLLCWVLLRQLEDADRERGSAWWCLAACVAVGLINVSRIALIGTYPEHYDLLHGPVGATVVNWTTVGVTVWLCSKGVTRGQEGAPAARPAFRSARRQPDPEGLAGR